MNLILVFCLIYICAKCGSSLIDTKYEEFKKKVEDEIITLRKGPNWQKYEKIPLPPDVKTDKKNLKYGNYVGTFIEVSLFSLQKLFMKYDFRLKISAQ